MTATGPTRPSLGRSLRPFTARPRLSLSLLLGLAVGLGLAVSPLGLRPATCGVIGWDAACVLFIGSVLSMMRGRTAPDIRKMAASQDEGKLMILALVIIAAAASLAAIGAELSLAKGDHGLLKAGRVGLAFATVAASWFVTQLIFALHYAHDYYGPGPGGKAEAGGLSFPGDEDPDYWDFLHFAVVIGVACQTADICLTSKPMRRLGTVQSAIAFTFNTVVLALTINLLASLI